MAVDIQAPYSIRHPDSTTGYTPYRTPYRTAHRTAHRVPCYTPYRTPYYTQGVGNLWTDPQIHSLAGDDYGDGNLGVGGMALFFSTSRYGPVTLALALDLDRALTLAPILTLASTSASPNPSPKPWPGRQVARPAPLRALRRRAGAHTVAARTTYGCRLPHTRSQAPSPTVAAGLAYGCSLPHLRLQARIEAHQEQLAASDPASAEGAPYLAPTQARHYRGDN
eukprot:scaffold88892_cov40-Phaeocystis_antarctica.AAC.2